MAVYLFYTNRTGLQTRSAEKIRDAVSYLLEWQKRLHQWSLFSDISLKHLQRRKQKSSTFDICVVENEK